MSTTHELQLPETCLVLMMGISGSGKSTFAREHFGEFEVLSSDYFRGLVGNDETNQDATAAAFDALHYVAGKRLEAGLLTVIDATNVQPAARASLIELAKNHDVLTAVIGLDLDLATCLERNAARGARAVPAAAVRRQHKQLAKSLKTLKKERHACVHLLTTEEQVANARIVRHKLLNDYREHSGPFDVIGDVHGCLDELLALLDKLGYQVEHNTHGQPVNAVHPHGRTVIFVGDLVDRGPDSAGVLRLAMGMHANGTALAVSGNHEAKLVKALKGDKVSLTHGLDATLEQIRAHGEEFTTQVLQWTSSLVAHLVLDGGKLVIAHAGLIEAYHGRASGRVRAFALYGQVTGEKDEYGLPVRGRWFEDYRGQAAVLYGHTPVTEVEWVNNTACLDTACAFGGKLSAMSWPERTTTSVPALAEYAPSLRPLESIHGPEREPAVLEIDDVAGPLFLKAPGLGSVKVSAGQAAGALESMSRFATDPRWLRYLPPTMSPVESSNREDYLEHPDQAFAYFAKQGVRQLICEQKHMGSRAVLLLARNASRFDAPESFIGVLHTRYGRDFMEPAAQRQLLDRAHAAATAAGLFDELDSDWLMLDGELLPWSLKSEGLLKDTYASVAAAGIAATSVAVPVLEAAAARGLDVQELLERTRRRERNVKDFRQAYRHYAGDPDQVRFAAFQVLAAEGATFETRDHAWHLDIGRRLAEADPSLFAPTAHRLVDLADTASTADAVQWWHELTAAGAEGMVVKPLANLVKGPRGWVQPGLKVRGQQYLKLIYGPDYLEPGNLERLRQRATDKKRAKAMSEYLLGLQALRLTAAGEPLWKVHQMVFGVLALESDPLDPRL